MTEQTQLGKARNEDGISPLVGGNAVAPSVEGDIRAADTGAASRERTDHFNSTSESEESGAATQTYWTKEAVGVFANPDALEAAVDELEVSGFDRAAISVLATDSKAREHLDRFYRSIGEVEDSGVVARANFMDSE